MQLHIYSVFPNMGIKEMKSNKVNGDSCPGTLLGSRAPSTRYRLAEPCPPLAEGIVRRLTWGKQLWRNKRVPRAV